MLINFTDKNALEQVIAKKSIFFQQTVQHFIALFESFFTLLDPKNLFPQRKT
jgi:hypothetical protein